MAGITIRQLSKTFLTNRKQKVFAVDAFDVEVAQGEIVALLGPSGCGKTTTLRSIAGLEKPDHGEIRIGDQVVFSSRDRIFVPPENRNLGMVFQSYAIWPHMTVFDNVAYPLQTAGVKGAELRERVHEMLTLVGCDHLADRYPGQMSGGQQQRVSLARALVKRPQVLLFDEPLSNLDARLRERMRFELVEIQRRVGFSAVYVTHDQAEAMTIAQRIVVMDSGKVLQVGTPQEIYSRPSARRVAEFIGTVNVLQGKVQSYVDGRVVVDGPIGKVQALYTGEVPLVGTSVDLCIRPESMTISVPTGNRTENDLTGIVQHSAYLGQYTAHVVKVGDASVQVYASADDIFSPGQAVHIQISPEHCFIFPST